MLVGQLVGSHVAGQALLTSPGQGGQRCRQAGRQRTVRACPWVGGGGAGLTQRGHRGVLTHWEVVGEPLQVDAFVLLQEHTDDEPVHLRRGLLSLGRAHPQPGCLILPLPPHGQVFTCLTGDGGRRGHRPFTEGVHGVHSIALAGHAGLRRVNRSQGKERMHRGLVRPETGLVSGTWVHPTPSPLSDLLDGPGLTLSLCCSSHSRSAANTTSAAASLG